MKKDIGKKEKLNNIVIIFCCGFMILICFALNLIFNEINNIKNSSPDIFNVSVHHIESSVGDLPIIHFDLNSGTKKTYNNKLISVIFDCYDANGLKTDGIFFVKINLEDDRSFGSFNEQLYGTGSYDTDIAYCEFNYAHVASE